MVTERNKTSRLLCQSSKRLFDLRSNPKFDNSFHRSVPGSSHHSTGSWKLFRPRMEYKSWNLHTSLYPLKRHGEISGAFMENSLRRTCQIQERYFGSVAPMKNPAFSALNSDDISYFKRLLGEKNVIQDEDKLEDANMDWMRKFKGSGLSNPWILQLQVPGCCSTGWKYWPCWWKCTGL